MLRVPRSASLCILLKPANAYAAITATRYASKGARQNVEGRQQLKTPFAVIQASGAKRPFFGQRRRRDFNSLCPQSHNTGLWLVADLAISVGRPGSISVVD